MQTKKKTRKTTYYDSDRIRQAQLRERRKAQGWKRISIWLKPDEVSTLEIMGEEWLGRSVKELLAKAMNEPKRPAIKQPGLFTIPDTGKSQWDEADSLSKTGLSWNEIARRWNEQGRRTPNGAEYRGANIAREVKKWKGGGVC